jgi:hypothetical protein
MCLLAFCMSRVCNGKCPDYSTVQLFRPTADTVLLNAEEVA